jgi:hypothetical protein
MIEQLGSMLPIAAGSVGTLAVARWLWMAGKVAQVARIIAVIMVLVVLGAVAGVVDLGRLLELARMGSGFLVVSP